MIFKNKKQIFAALFAVAIFVLILFAPNKQKNSSSELSATEVDSKPLSLEEAVNLVSSGTDPMNGIFRIREIAENNHENIEAQAYLMVFSLQSGQFEKAENRFSHLMEHELTNEQLQKVIEILEKTISSTQDKRMIDEIERYINEFKKL